MTVKQYKCIAATVMKVSCCLRRWKGVILNVKDAYAAQWSGWRTAQFLPDEPFLLFHQQTENHSKLGYWVFKREAYFIYFILKTKSPICYIKWKTGEWQVITGFLLWSTSVSQQDWHCCVLRREVQEIPEIMEHQMFGADSGGNGNNENRRKLSNMCLNLTVKREIFSQKEGT